MAVRFLFSLITLLMLSISCFGQDARSAEEKLAEMNASTTQHLTQGPDLLLDSINYYHRYLTYQSEVIDHRSETYNWQLTSSKIIFVVVIIIVLSGLVFSAIQFHITFSSSKKTKTLPAISDSNIKVSGEGIEITSSILGVIILGLSIVFFFLYIKYVYPIKEEANIKLLTLPVNNLEVQAQDTAKQH